MIIMSNEYNKDLFSHESGTLIPSVVPYMVQVLPYMMQVLPYMVQVLLYMVQVVPFVLRVISTLLVDLGCHPVTFVEETCSHFVSRFSSTFRLLVAFSHAL